MKIFISHSSKNADYGNALVDLLISIGIKSEDIIFTSNDAYGIPIGNNIFNWLKDKIIEKPFVIYLLSPSYYKSVACLNEMGAAWVVENDHAMIYTPNFDLKSPEFLNGAIDPREIGFYINNESRIIAFIDTLKTSFTVTPNNALINQKVKSFLMSIRDFNDLLTRETEIQNSSATSIKLVNPSSKNTQNLIKKIPNIATYDSRFLKDFESGKLKDEEIILAKYIIDNNRFHLFAGWQISNEIETIRVWEDINDLNDKLSKNYESILRRLEVKKLIKVFATTSGGNAKEYELVSEFADELINCEELISEIFKETARNNKKEEDFPF